MATIAIGQRLGSGGAELAADIPELLEKALKSMTHFWPPSKTTQ